MGLIRKILGLLLFVCLVGSTAIAREYPLRHYTVADGLPSSEVYHVFQDSKGFIWFATDMGVARFDGYEYVVYDVTNGLLDNTIFEIFEDPMGRLWFVSMSGKLCYYIDGRIEQYRFNDRIDSEFENDKIIEKSTFYVDSVGTVSFATRGSKIIKIDNDGELNIIREEEEASNRSWQFIHPQWRPPIPQAIYSEKPNMYIVSKLLQDSIIVLPIQKNISRSYIRCCKSGYVVTICDVIYYITFSGEIIKFPMTNQIIYLTAVSDGVFWVGMESGGAMKFRIKESSLIKESTLLVPNSVTSIFEDNENGVWFSCRTNGVFYLGPPYTRTSRIFDEISMPVSGFTQGKDSVIFVSIDNECYYVIQNDSIQKKCLAEPIHELVLRFFYDKVCDNLYLGTQRNISVKDGTGYKKIGNDYLFALSFLQDSVTESVWIGSTRGLLNFHNDSLLYFSVSAGHLNARIEALSFGKSHDYFWVGTSENLLKFYPTSKTYDTIQYGKFNQKITDLLFEDNRLFIGTKEGGLFILDKDTIFQYQSKELDIGKRIHKLYLYKNELWISSNRGLFVLALDEDKNLSHLRKISLTNDLIRGEVYDIIEYQNHLLFATNAGVLEYFPQPLGQITPPLYITGVNINLHDVEISQHYLLSRNENNIKFKFSALSFIIPHQQKYFYRLTGIDDQWQSTKNTEVVYHNLPPGNFTFEVKYNSDSDPNNLAIASLSLHIKKPFWKTIWFILIVVTVIGGVVLASFYQKIAHVKIEAARREEILDARQKALINQINPHFIFNSLNSIQLYILDNDVVKSSMYLSKFARLIRSALDKSQLNKVTLYEELELNQLYMEMEKLRFKEKLSYEFINNLPINTGKILLPPFLIQPLLENAIWHGIMTKTDEQGKIIIELNSNEDSLIITIIDNGIGRKAAKEQREKRNLSHKPIGMSISRRRLLLLSQQFEKKYMVYYTDIYKGDGTIAGTKVTLIVPLEIAHE